MMALLSACAHITIKKIPPGTNISNRGSDGIHFYSPKPYLMISQTLIASPGGGQPIQACTAEIKYFPDYNEEYVMIPHYWLESISMKPAVADGWNLTNFNSTVDTKIPETITAISSLAQNIPKAFNAPQYTTGPRALRPGLYPLGHNNETGNLTIEDTRPVFTAASTCNTLSGIPPKASEEPKSQKPSK